MAMEPISGVVAFQAQQYQSNGSEVKLATPTGKSAEEFVEVQKNSANVVDKTTVTVSTADQVEIYKDGNNQMGNRAVRTTKRKPSNEAEEQFEEFSDKEHERLREMIEEINKHLTDTEALFGYHDATNRVTIKIVNKSTKEVIKEIPPEKNLDLLAKSWEIAGILVDRKG